MVGVTSRATAVAWEFSAKLSPCILSECKPTGTFLGLDLCSRSRRLDVLSSPFAREKRTWKLSLLELPESSARLLYPTVSVVSMSVSMDMSAEQKRQDVHATMLQQLRLTHTIACFSAITMLV